MINLRNIDINRINKCIEKEIEKNNVIYINLFFNKLYFDVNIKIDKESLQDIIRSNSKLIEVSKNIFLEKEFLKNSFNDPDIAKELLNKEYLIIDFYEENISSLFSEDKELKDESKFSVMLDIPRDLNYIVNFFGLENNEIIKRQAELVLSMDENIKILDNNKYFYSLGNQDYLSNLFKAINKIKFISEKLDLRKLIFSLLNRDIEVLTIGQITEAINIIGNYEQFEIDNVLKSNKEFMRVDYDKWAMNKSNYKEFKMNFEITLNEVKSSINQKDRFEIIERYLLNEKKETLQEIGEDYGLTRERIRQIIGKIKKQLTHPSRMKKLKPYSNVLKNIIKDKVALSINQLANNQTYKEVFEGFDVRWIINFFQLLNTKNGSYIVLYDQFILNYKDKDYRKILKEFEKKFRNKKEINIIPLREIEKFFMNFSIQQKEFIRVFLENEQFTFYIEKDRNILIRKNSQIIKPDTIYYLLDKIGVPTYYLGIIDEYKEITKDYEMSERAFLAMFQRSENIVRIHSGVFALKEWGMKKHMHTRDWNYKVLKDNDSPMHYKDIIEVVSKYSYSKHQTIYINLNEDNRIFGFKDGTYGLEEWLQSEEKMESLGIVEGDIKSRLIGRRNVAEIIKGRSDNITLKTDLTPAMVQGGYLNFIRDMNYEFNENLYIFTYDNSKFPITYGKPSNSLYRLKKVYEYINLKSYEVIYLEIISKDIVRLLYENEYENYRPFTSSLLEEAKNIARDFDEKVDIIENPDDLKQFGLKYGYVKYSDLESIEDKISDINDLLDELNDMGVKFK